MRRTRSQHRLANAVRTGSDEREVEPGARRKSGSRPAEPTGKGEEDPRVAIAKARRRNPEVRGQCTKADSTMPAGERAEGQSVTALPRQGLTDRVALTVPRGAPRGGAAT